MFTYSYYSVTEKNQQHRDSMLCTTDAKKWSERNEENIKLSHRKMLKVTISLYGGLCTYNFYVSYHANLYYIQE